MLSERHEAVALEIKKDDKFFTRIMSKDTSMANSSCRIYYGGASGAIPFMWESRPGTPKNTCADTSIPPLTPPPSYYSTCKSKYIHKRSSKQNLFTTFFPRLASQTSKITRLSPSSSMSSPTTTSFSSLYLSPSILKNSRSRNRLFFSCSMSPIHGVDGDEDEEEGDNYKYNEHRIRSPTTTLCYGW